MLIRTGGQNRLSDFMLWQMSYTELFFLKKLWPDFNTNDFKKILKSIKKLKEILVVLMINFIFRACSSLFWLHFFYGLFILIIFFFISFSYLFLLLLIDVVCFYKK